jgi:hypothetical protein
MIENGRLKLAAIRQFSSTFQPSFSHDTPPRCHFGRNFWYKFEIIKSDSFYSGGNKYV